MNHVFCSITILLATATTVQANETSSPHSLGLTASKPQIHISRQADRRDYLRLPSLEYAFVVTAQCGVEFEPESVSLSIADSHKSLSVDRLTDLATGAELKMTVPAKQLAPLAITNFCVESGDDTGPEDASGDAMISVRAVYSAQAALICANESQRQIVYASNPLDITLICGAEEEPASE